MKLSHAVATAAILMAPLAYGQEADNWEGETELGVLVTSGNTKETNAKGRVAVLHEVETWRNNGELRANYSETDDETTAEKYQGSLETNYKFAKKHYWFLRGAYQDDRFSGYDFESSLTTGYGQRVWTAGEQSFLDLSAGAGYRYNKLEEATGQDEDTEKEAIARFAGHLDYEVSDTALFRQKLSTEIGLDDNNTITESETSLQATVAGDLSMKVAFRVEHQSRPPEGAENTDTETSLSLLYGF
ncbi:DUF481 domain-containing protein [Marinobacter oulmenensis]|uniref:Putative salt-induced outer membrane protein YdiY n=1 Tax=Marinobacter oulmenensis TaxID=643747 RepID=A0A840UH75_9GAMM|nr:DUF481 domain-containing protein [Marinobacter oulmenensis]MBB5320137.1 putative salt-induced outer membrane protein YdiY [Marinobacter oulmenensis]